jgi:gamma-butyrobetaine dioxygenase
METNLRHWHGAAKKFNDIIHRPENIHERMMKPGECVIFDNRRVLHARKAFEVADAGKERWLRGAYLDKDPFMSKLRVLAHRFSTPKDFVVVGEEVAEVAAVAAS